MSVRNIDVGNYNVGGSSDLNPTVQSLQITGTQLNALYVIGGATIGGAVHATGLVANETISSAGLISAYNMITAPEIDSTSIINAVNLTATGTTTSAILRCTNPPSDPTDVVRLTDSIVPISGSITGQWQDFDEPVPVSATIQYYIIGKQITFYQTGMYTVNSIRAIRFANTSGAFNVIPSQYIPSTNYNIPIMLTFGGNPYMCGAILIQTDGSITIYREGGGTFDDGTTSQVMEVQITPWAVSWFVN